MPRAVLLGALATGLAGCGIFDLGKVYRTETRTNRVVAIDQPKHFGVTVRDVDGRDWRISVSKHCNPWQRTTRIGMTLPIVYEYKVYKDGRRTVGATDRGLQARLCGW